MRFDTPLKVMKLLDRLEDYIPGNEQKSIYLRRKLPLICQTAGQPDQLRKIEAWVYVYPEHHLSNEHHREVRIECGQWKAFNGPTQAETELDVMFERLSYCDSQQQVMVDPLLGREKLLDNAPGIQPCYHFCENRDRCGWSKSYHSGES